MCIHAGGTKDPNGADFKRSQFIWYIVLHYSAKLAMKTRMIIRQVPPASSCARYCMGHTNVPSCHMFPPMERISSLGVRASRFGNTPGTWAQLIAAAVLTMSNAWIAYVGISSAWRARFPLFSTKSAINNKYLCTKKTNYCC